MDSLLRIFPQKRRAFWQKTADNGEKICEIRLRVDRPVIVETSRGDYFLNNGGEWQEHPYGSGDTGVDRLAVSGFGVCLCR